MILNEPYFVFRVLWKILKAEGKGHQETRQRVIAKTEECHRRHSFFSFVNLHYCISSTSSPQCNR